MREVATLRATVAETVLGPSMTGRALFRDDRPRRTWMLASACEDEPQEPRRWIAWFVAGVDRQRLEMFLDATVEEALRGAAEIRADLGLARDLRDAAAEEMRSFLRILSGDADDAELPPAGVAFARTLARQGLAAEVLLKVHRLGQSAFWRETMAESERFVTDPVLRNRVLAIMWERLNRWLDGLLDALSAVHREERARWVKGALARRMDVIASLLAGGEVDAARAGRELGYELTREHTALVLWDAGPPTGDDVVTRLEREAQTIATAAGGHRALTAPAGTRALWAWIGAADVPDSPVAMSDFCVAIGRGGTGIAGFRESHAEALAAQRVALAGTRRFATVHRYDDVELVAMLSQDEDAMRALMRRALGALAADDAPSARLRATALAYIECGHNATSAARRLGVHKNTVRHRLARIEELLERPIGERDLQLRLALMLAQAFGPGAP